MPIFRALTLMALIAAAACSNPEGPSDSGGSGGGTTVNGQTLALTIDGTAFQPNSVVVSIVPAAGPIPELLSILASDGGTGGGNAQNVTISLPNRVGTYSIPSSTNVVVLLRRGAFGTEQWWEASNGFGNGSIEITSRSGTVTEGRMNLSLGPSGIGAGSAGKTLAGTFSVRY